MDTLFGFAVQAGVGPPIVVWWGEDRWDSLSGIGNIFDLEVDELFKCLSDFLFSFLFGQFPRISQSLGVGDPEKLGKSGRWRLGLE